MAEIMGKVEGGGQIIAHIIGTGPQGKQGVPGPKGDPGNDGHTPVKGIDYFTPEDIAEFKASVTPVKGVDYFTPVEVATIESNAADKAAAAVGKDIAAETTRAMEAEKQLKSDLGELNDGLSIISTKEKTDGYDNILTFSNHVFDTDSVGISIKIENGLLYVHGKANTIAVRLKLTNGYDFTTDNTTPSAWTAQSINVTNGKTYCTKLNLVSGSIRESNDSIVLSVRNSSNTSIASINKNPAIVTSDGAYALVFIMGGVTFNHCVYKPIVVNGDTPTLSTYDVKINEDVRLPQMDSLFYHVNSDYGTGTTVYNDNLSSYGAVQGMCSDGENLYYSVWRNDNSANTLLRKYNIANGKVIVEKENHCYGHANGMCYLPFDNTILICNMDETGTVSKINADTLEYVDEFSLNDILSPVVPWWMGVGAVAYDIKREKIIFLLRGVKETDGRTRKGFAVFDSHMRFEKVIKTEYIESDTYSGLCTDDDFVYLSISNPTSTSRGEHLIAYDWHGNVVNDVVLTGMSHFEAQAFVGGNLYTATNENYRGATLKKYTPVSKESVSKIDVMCKYNLN